MRNILWLTLLLTLTACGGDADNKPGASGSTTGVDTTLPLEMPLMETATILTPIKTRSNGEVQETIFKVLASPDQVAAFYDTELEKRGFKVQRTYADKRALDMWAENDTHRVILKGSTNLSVSPSSESLADGETRVLMIGKQL